MKKNYIALISLVLLVFFQTTFISYCNTPEVTAGAFENVRMKQKIQSTNNTVYLLDSTLVLDGNGKIKSKTINNWNQKGDLITSESFKLGYISNVLENNEKRLYAYNDSHKDTLYIIYQWNSDIGKWSESIKYRNEYDINLNKTKTLSYSWNEQKGIWLLERKAEMTYDEKNNQTSLHSLVFDTISSSWKNLARQLYEFDNYGNMLTSKTYSWNTINQQWKISSKIYNYYADTTNVALLLSFSNNNTAKELEANGKTIFEYDDSMRQISSEQYYWDGSKWNGWVKNATSYDSTGLMESKSYIRWDNNINDWNLVNKTNYEYDIKGNCIRETKVYFDKELNIWKSDYKYEYLYDAKNNLIQKSYYTNNSGWALEESTNYYYTPVNI
jgi:hypothetical protein